MGAISDRTREHLGQSDIAIIRMRRRMLESVKAFEATGTPLGVGPDLDYTATRSVQAVIAKEMPWQELADSVRAAGGGTR